MRTTLVALSLLFATIAVARADEVDLILRGGRIVDGSGRAPVRGDVGIKDGRIVFVGANPGATAKRTLDVANLVVAPGFIDMHNHADTALLADGDAPSLLFQGVTSVILGEGGSMAPSAAFPTFKKYFDKLIAGGTAINVGSYVGSSQIWTEVRGERGGPPTRGELEKMKAHVQRAMQDGALGVASSLSGPPGAWIDTGTLVAMCAAAAPFGGIYSTHVRHEGEGVWKAVDEALEIGRRANLPVDIIHIKISEHALWGQMPKLIDKLAAARAAGARVEANVYPYRAGQNDLASIVPPWAHEGGRAALIRRLKEPGTRARIAGEITKGLPGWYNHYTATGSWQGMLLVSLSNPGYQRFAGKRMDEVIGVLGGELGVGKDKPIDVFFQVLIDNGGSVPTIFFHHSEEDMRFALKTSFVSIGSDGGSLRPEGPRRIGHPHPRFYGTFPRVLGRYVRDDKVITLEDAIRKMTAANARKVGLTDRGLLEAGKIADVTVFDPARIIDNATFENPHQYSTGVVHVLVAGRLELEAGKPTGVRAGGILYGRGHQR